MLSKSDKTRIVQAYARKGYPGIHKLRTSCYQPLLNRLSMATGKPEKELRVLWTLLSPRYFWPTVRGFAADKGISNIEAFMELLDTPVVPTLNPHPLLCHRG